MSVGSIVNPIYFQVVFVIIIWNMIYTGYSIINSYS